MYCVYILQSEKDGGFYIGYTSNIDKRLQQHNSGKTRSLKYRIPFKIIHIEEFSTIKEAKNRELQIKSYKGGEAFKKLIGIPGSPLPPYGGGISPAISGKSRSLRENSWCSYGQNL